MPPAIPSDPSAGAAPRSIRLTLAYDESGIQVVDRTSVSKPVPPSAPPPASFGAPVRGAAAPVPADAVVAELRTGDDATMYRQIVEHAIPHDVEVFDPGVERGAYRHPVPPASGVFTVVVPDDAAAQDVVLIAGEASTAAVRTSAAPPARGGGHGGPVEVARFPLRGDHGG